MDKAAGSESTNRRVFFDFTISPPKSVSIAALIAYTVENLARGDCEITEVPADVRERFSKRHPQIDAQTMALLTEHPELHGANVKHSASTWRMRSATGKCTASRRRNFGTFGPSSSAVPNAKPCIRLHPPAAHCTIRSRLPKSLRPVRHCIPGACRGQCPSGLDQSRDASP